MVLRARLCTRSSTPCTMNCSRGISAGVFRRDAPPRRRDAMSKGEGGGVACDHIRSSIQSARFVSMHVGQNQPSSTMRSRHHQALKMAAQRKTFTELATRVAIATNKTMEMRLNRSGNVLPLLLERSKTLSSSSTIIVARWIGPHSNMLTNPSWP